MRRGIRTFVHGAALAALALVLPAVAPASASAQFRSVEISPTVGWIFGGSFYTTEGEATVPESMSYGGNVDVGFGGGRYARFSYLRQESEVRLRRGGFEESLFDLAINYWHVGAIQELEGNDRLRPYAGLGLGMTHFSPQEGGRSSDYKFSTVFSAGVKVKLAEMALLQVTGRGLWTSLYGGTSFFCGTGGCSVGLGGTGVWQGDVSAMLTIPLG